MSTHIQITVTPAGKPFVYKEDHRGKILWAALGHETASGYEWEVDACTDELAADALLTVAWVNWEWTEDEGEPWENDEHGW